VRNNRYSDLKVVQFPAKLESFIRGEITAPIYVRVKPINRCNHACAWCIYKSDRQPGRRDESHMASVPSNMHTDMSEADVMPSVKMLEVLDDFQTMGVKAVTFSGGGEPLLHKEIIRFMTRCLHHGIDLSLITNGQLLNGARAEVLSHAKWVRVSMDYTNAEQMAHTRLVHPKLFEEVLANLQAFARIKNRDCDLAVNYIVHRENRAGLVAFAERLFRLGVENIRFSPMYCDDFQAYHAPIKDEVEAQLREIAGRIVAGHNHNCRRLEQPQGFAPLSVNTTYDLASPAHSPVRTYHRCYFMQTVPVVGADQKVYACHNKAYDATGCIGSVKEQSFKALWFSPEAKAFFEKLDPACDCRHQCANDGKNRHIQNLITTAPDNFV
jgi:MoaA/NifB/PqqE/SkfB family radical SAM enzyme